MKLYILDFERNKKVIDFTMIFLVLCSCTHFWVEPLVQILILTHVSIGNRL